MRKYIFSAMVLVLGLFTVTAGLAFTFSKSTSLIQSDVYYFDQEIGNPEDVWDQEGSWKELPEPISCNIGNIPCSITVPANFDNLQQYLDHLSNIENETWGTLANHNNVVPRS